MSSSKPGLGVAAALCILASGPVHAGDFDGSRQLICAPSEANDCGAGDGCARTTPREAGVPAFVRIDFSHKAVVGPQRTSAIQIMERSDTQLLLLGTELGLSWTLALDQSDGTITVTMANRDGVFVIFGACTPA